MTETTKMTDAEAGFSGGAPCWAERICRMMLEDLTRVMNESGENSEAYKRQLKHAVSALEGSLLEVIQAALNHWQCQRRDKSCQTTQID